MRPLSSRSRSLFPLFHFLASPVAGVIVAEKNGGAKPAAHERASLVPAPFAEHLVRENNGRAEPAARGTLQLRRHFGANLVGGRSSRNGIGREAVRGSLYQQGKTMPASRVASSILFHLSSILLSSRHLFRRLGCREKTAG